LGQHGVTLLGVRSGGGDRGQNPAPTLGAERARSMSWRAAPAAEILSAVPGRQYGGPHCLDQKNAFLSYTLDPSFGLFLRHSVSPR
jgi:hypothetical protein